MPRRSPLITVMANAAYKAARGLCRDFGEVEQLQVSRKGPADFVSSADHKAEQTLVEELQRARPNFGFLVEEGGEIKGEDSSNRWIIDPLDGTTNFLHGIPHFAISIGLERDGRMFAGVIYDPLRDELFWAETGIGAFINSQRLRVSSRARLGDALIATGMPFKGRASHPEYPVMLDSVWAATSGVRRFGSAALDLAYVAAGRYDGFWEFALSPWDIAAGLVILREAGGIVSEVDGGDQMMESGDILATNGHLHEYLQELLAQAAAPGP
ncbi:MAG: inositol monophosphatase family protein [Alphaproteobacteria bacterium]|nr:inositol monophosphatase family protein [Alphaproteobacteria bacterium]